MRECFLVRAFRETRHSVWDEEKIARVFLDVRRECGLVFLCLSFLALFGFFLLPCTESQVLAQSGRKGQLKMLLPKLVNRTTKGLD